MATESAYEAPPLSEAEQRNSDEITDRRARLVKALLAATTAFGEASEEIGHLNGSRVYDVQFEESGRVNRLLYGAGQFLDALVADVLERLDETSVLDDDLAVARDRADYLARQSYLGALANAVPLFSASALANRPIA